MKNPLVGLTHVPPRPYALRRDLLRSFVRYGRYGKDFYRYIVRPIDAQSPCADSIFPIRALAPIHTSIHTSTLRQNSSKDATPPLPPKIVSRVRAQNPLANLRVTFGPSGLAIPLLKKRVPSRPPAPPSSSPYLSRSIARDQPDPGSPDAEISNSKFFDLNQIQGSSGHATLFLTARMRQNRRPSALRLDKGEFKMSVTEKLFLASILALSIAAPVQAQSPTQGDYYAPGPTVVVHPTQGQLKQNEQGDYYVGDKMILNKRRAEALKTCTHNKAFDSDSYVACMARLGEAP